MIAAIARKEFKTLFALPSTWLILGALQFIFAWFFLARLDVFLQLQAQLAQIANAPGATLAIVTPLFGTLTLLLMMLIPLFAMRLFAEEARNRTMALLLSSPVSGLHIVFGKFFGLLLFLLPIMASGVVMALSLAAGTKLDTGLVLTNALGILLLASSYASLAMYISSLTAQPALAAIGGMAALFGLWLMDIGSEDNPVLHAMAPSNHFQSFNTGLINSADLVYFVLFTAVFLLLAARRLHNNRMYG